MYVQFRPYLNAFLEEAAKHFELVLFTAAETDYASMIMEAVDPGRKFARYRIFRESCIHTPDAYIKDLNLVGREIGKTIIVDNTLHAFSYHVP